MSEDERKERGRRKKEKETKRSERREKWISKSKGNKRNINRNYLKERTEDNGAWKKNIMKLIKTRAKKKKKKKRYTLKPKWSY